MNVQKIPFLQKLHISSPALLSTSFVGKGNFIETTLRKFPKGEKLLPYSPRAETSFDEQAQFSTIHPTLVCLPFWYLTSLGFTVEPRENLSSI